MKTIIQSIEKIEDLGFKSLAKDIYKILIKTNRISEFEFLVNDIYFQIGEKESFTFSVEIRGDDAEFFLFDLNFIVSNQNDFKPYRRNILSVINSVVEGRYNIELVKFRKKTIKSDIVFGDSFRVRLYNNLIFGLFSQLIPKRAFALVVKKGNKI